MIFATDGSLRTLCPDALQEERVEQQGVYAVEPQMLLVMNPASKHGTRTPSAFEHSLLEETRQACAFLDCADKQLLLATKLRKKWWRKPRSPPLSAKSGRRRMV